MGKTLKKKLTTLINKPAKLELTRLSKADSNAFMPLEHDSLGYAQCDWAPAMAQIAGQDIQGELFLLRFSHSKAFFVQFYPNQRQEAFFDAHEHAFTFFNGVPVQIPYDNLKTAVKKALLGQKREEQDRLRNCPFVPSGKTASWLSAVDI